MSYNSNIKLEFKINYICSDDCNEHISFRIKNSKNDIIFIDKNLGPSLGITYRGIYNGFYIDTNNYNSSITYHIEYLINSDKTVLDNSCGILGTCDNNSNILLAQELYIP